MREPYWPTRRDRHPARVIARREGNDAPLPLFRRKLQQAVGRPPQLERAAGLQALAFEPYASAAHIAFDQRRALDLTGDSRRRFDDIFAGDHSRFC